MSRPTEALSMNPDQTELVESALHQLAKLDPCGWDQIPEPHKPVFAAYMGRDAWAAKLTCLRFATRP